MRFRAFEDLDSGRLEVCKKLAEVIEMSVSLIAGSQSA
jgi:hypothetical protein